MSASGAVSDGNGTPLWLKALGAFGLAILTAGLTVGGEFLVEGRKANLDVWKAVQNIQVQISQDREHRQIEALYQIQSDLKILEGELLLLFKEAAPLKSPAAVRNDAAEAARTMSRIYPRIVILDSKLKTVEAIKSLLDQLSPVLAEVSPNPTKNDISKFLDYYSHEFGTGLNAASLAVQTDINQLQSQNTSKVE